MKRTQSFLGTGLPQAALLIGLGLWQGSASAVTFTNTPLAVSNTYAGPITLQIGGLTNGETVMVQQFLDANTNGVIDAGDWRVQQFRLTDGVASLIGTATNINVPGDLTPTNGAITVEMSYVTTGPGLATAAPYLYRLASPTANFVAVTNQFNVTNLPYPQSITGNVVCSGTNVPNALIMVFTGPAFESTPVGAAVGNNAGGYSFPLPPGTYNLIAFKTDYVADAAAAPQVVLGSGATVSTNLSLLSATCSISGRVQDAVNPSLGLPGLWVFPQSAENLVGIGITAPNGNFTAQVTASLWEIGFNDMQFPALGYLGSESLPRVDTSTGSVANVTIALPKGTALVYGSVKDAADHPLPGVVLWAENDSEPYDASGVTDQNGNYAVAVVAGNWGIRPDTSGSPAYANYIFPLVRDISLSDGLAVRKDLVGLVATNQISGYLKDGGNNPISGVWIWAQATINSTSYEAGMDTDETGHYAINVCNGQWTVGVSCGGGEHSLGSEYVCPSAQFTNIVNNHATVDFTALPPTSQIQGYVRDNSSDPIPNVRVYGRVSPNGPYDASGTTDTSGYYSFSVANGSYYVGVECCGNNGLSPLGYVCVGQQTTSVDNSTNTVNFTASPAPYQITGRLRDASNNPIPNVGVSADHDDCHACATSASDGSYTLYVTNSTWHVYPDCNTLSLLGYLCPGDLQVTVFNANAVLDLTALQAPYTISGWVRDTTNQPFTNLNVYAYTTFGTNSYQSGSLTDSSGHYSLPVASAQWFVGVDCGGVGSGYLCPNEVTIAIAGASVVTNFTIQPCGALQIPTTSPLPDGQVGVAYDFYLQASSCHPPFSFWYVISGSLPPGLDLDFSTGEILGTPTTAGTFNFTVQVTDSNDTATTKALALTINPPPGDVLSYSITKMEAFWQSDATTLAPDTAHGPFSATLSIIQSAPDTVPIANVYLPGGAVRGFPWGGSGIELQAREYFATEAALDAVYANGSYTFAMATRNNGFQFPVLTNPAAVYPSAPRVSNFAAAQLLNPASPFTLQWTPPSDATTNDFIWTFIVNGSGTMIFSTPYPPTNSPASLRGTATSVVIPPDTFQLGDTYTGVIIFFRITSVNTANYSGALGMTLVAVDTAFPMAAPAASLPVLSQPTRISDTQFGFLLSGIPGTEYTILASTNVSLPVADWFQVLTTNLAGDSALIEDNQATNQQRFYRAKVGP